MTFGDPVYTVSAKAVSLVSEISAALERYKILMEGPDGVRLRKLNRIRTIRGTTAIEGNTLTEEQVTAILSGKRVVGSKREIDEIKGAQAAYAAVETFDPLSARDLLRAHALMTQGLVERPGKWRTCNVGVFNAKGEALHHAPPWDHVPFLMKDLFAWLKRAKDLPLIKSCVFHFAFECIHPFPDGNGRVGRLWQTAILGRWNPLFYAAPVENMVFSHQSRYYRALQSAQAAGDAGAFIDFMLDVILRTIKARGVRQGGKKTVVRKGGKKTADRILELVSANPKVTFAELVGALGISRSAIQKHVVGLKDAQRLRRIGPDKGGRWEVVRENKSIKRRGFTLVEMLLATLLVGVLTALSVMTFQSVSRGWQVSADYLDKMQRTDYALGQVVAGLRSMHYPHDGKQNADYGFVLEDRGTGESPDRSDVITWSKTGPAIVGTKSALADTVHRVQVMVLEEGNDDYAEPIQKTGLYARLCGDAALIPKDDSDDTDYSFGNADLYQPILVADGVSGFNCRVLAKAEDVEGGKKNEGENEKRDFEDTFAESNAVPYKVELTFYIEKPDENFRSRTDRAPMVRIVRIPIHEQSLDGATPPGNEEKEKKGGKKK